MMNTANRRGSSLVEFSVALLPLMVLIFGVIEMDRMLLVYNALDNAAAAGVRNATVHGCYSRTSGVGGNCSSPPTATTQAIVKNFASMGILDPTQVTVNVTYVTLDKTGTTITASDNIGSTVTVSATYPYAPLTGLLPWNVTIGTTAAGTVAY
jgi:Flp pilus assembly protein TadG